MSFSLSSPLPRSLFSSRYRYDSAIAEATQRWGFARLPARIDRAQPLSQWWRRCR